MLARMTNANNISLKSYYTKSSKLSNSNFFNNVATPKNEKAISMTMTRNRVSIWKTTLELFYIIVMILFLQYGKINANEASLCTDTISTADPTKLKAIVLCEKWCLDHPTPWTDPDTNVEQKCHWVSSCGGCPECNVGTILTKCKPWCHGNQIAWSHPDPKVAQKCHWEESCSECPECDTTITSTTTTNESVTALTSTRADPSDTTFDPSSASTTSSPTRNNCKEWCANHPTPWYNPDPTVEQKCKWPINCGGCPECSIFDRTVSTTSTTSVTSPAKTKACEKWCVNHPKPWNDPDLTVSQKCKWPHTCGGCPQCFP